MVGWSERRFSFPYDPKQLTQPRLLEIALILLALLSLFRLLGRVLGQAPFYTGWTLVELFLLLFSLVMLIRSRLIVRRLSQDLAGGLVLHIESGQFRFSDRQGGSPNPSWERITGLPLGEISEVNFEQIQRVELVSDSRGEQRLMISFTPHQLASGDSKSRLVLAPPWPVEEIARELGERLGGDEPS